MVLLDMLGAQPAGSAGTPASEPADPGTDAHKRQR
jgi:hypothetical protein